MMTEKRDIWLSGILVYIHTNLGLSWKCSYRNHDAADSYEKSMRPPPPSCLQSNGQWRAVQLCKNNVYVVLSQPTICFSNSRLLVY